jgi:hypothetical protein
VPVTVSRNFGPLVPVVQNLLTKPDWERVGRMAREKIVLRTRQGRDYNGTPFQRYSAGYAKAKAAEVGAGPVNLQLSGEMLNAITVEADNNSVTLAFNR